MRAWRFVGPRKPLERADLPDPVAGPGEAVVRVRAAGLCHSDLHLIDGSFPFPAPLTLGHEGAGEVAEIGEGVTNVSVGDAVAVYGPNSCGACGPCKGGRENLCESNARVGLGIDGSFADMLVCRATSLIPIPDGVSFEAAAVATDAILTPYHGLHSMARVRSGERVAVFGLGGLGLNAVQIARTLGANVTAIDPVESKRNAALACGASAVAADGNALAGQMDVAADFVGVEDSMRQAQMAVKAGGRVLLVGLGSPMGPLLAYRFGAQEISILGAFWGTRAELVDCLDLVQLQKVKPAVEVHALDGVNEQIERLQAGEVLGRVALVP